MDHYQARNAGPNGSDDSNEKQNPAVFMGLSMSTADHSTHVGQITQNYNHQQNLYRVNQRFRDVPLLPLSSVPALHSDYLPSTWISAANYSMHQQHAVSAGDLPPRRPADTGATAPRQALVVSPANTRPPHPKSSGTTPEKLALPDKVMIQVKGKWFVALVTDEPHSIMDRDFAQKFLELKVMPIPRRQVEEFAAVSDGHSSGPKEFTVFDAHIHSLNLESWEMNVALLQDTWRHLSAPLVLGQSFFERLEKSRGTSSHRPNENHLQGEIASRPSAQSISRITAHSMHDAPTIGRSPSVAFGERASSAGANFGFGGSRTVDPRDFSNRAENNYLGGASPGMDGFS